MRAIWALAVVCLLAVAGPRAPTHDGVERGPHAQRIARVPRVDERPALPVVVGVRQGALGVAVRPAAPAPGSPLAVLATPPAVALRAAWATAVAPHRAHAPGSASVPTRSARGPPVC